MKKKLALLMAAMMTVSLVPVTAFASTKLTAVDEITTAVDDVFTSRVELVKDNDQVNINVTPTFDVYAKLTNGKFAYEDDDDDKEYAMDSVDGNAVYNVNKTGIVAVDVIDDTTAKVTIDTDVFNQSLSKGNSDPSQLVYDLITALDTDNNGSISDDEFATGTAFVDFCKGEWTGDTENQTAVEEAYKDGWMDDSANKSGAYGVWKTANETDVKNAWIVARIQDDDFIADQNADLGHIATEPELTTEATNEYNSNTEDILKGECDLSLSNAHAKATYLALVYDENKALEEQADAAWALLTSADEVDAYYEDSEGHTYYGDANEDVKADYENSVKSAYEAYVSGEDLANEKSGLKACVLPIIAKAVENGEVVVTFTSNVSAFKKASEVIATAVDGDAEITVDGIKTFVEDSSETEKELKNITINGLSNGAITKDITLKLKGNFKFTSLPKVSLLNDDAATAGIRTSYVGNDDDEIKITFGTAPLEGQLAKITINGLKIKTTKKCDSGDVATITVSSDKNKDFSAVKLEVAKMVEEAVTYSVEDDTLPVIWAGKLYDDNDEANSLKVSVEENTGDILNTSRKATFTFPEGIEVVGISDRKGLTSTDFKYEIDENVVTIYNYQKGDAESKKTDFELNFILNAAPTFSGDVNVTLGGQFDDVSLKVATVKAPYTVEAKTTDVLIDYRYVPVNNIVITEAEDGLLEDDDVIALAVEKMDFEDAGDLEVTEGDIDADVDIDDDYGDYNYDVLKVTIKDASTEASTMTISGLELYLDRTLPVGGYALTNIKPDGTDKNILWENSTTEKGETIDDYDYVPDANNASNGLFKYKELTINDEYVNVITAARDQDDSMTTKKIIITVGATTMTAGTETVTLDAPAYINAENYTMLPLRAITEAFGATVNWDDATRTVTILSGQRIISMTIGSKTMYINGTPVAMNTAPEITSDRTFVPVRDLANSLGISNINWTEASGTVTLN